MKVVETVPHGGHYRIAFASDRATLVDPAVTGTCGSAAIQTTPTLPVLADGVFPHTQAQAAANTPYETDVTLPNVPPGRYTLQVLEFMTPHAAPCFYYHCASVEIVAPDAGIADGGVVVVDAGAPPSGDGGAASPPVSSAPGGGDGGAAGAPLPASEADGCNAGSADAGGLAVPALAALVALGAARRRRGAARAT